jgi:small subunit ribosomal protein S1
METLNHQPNQAQDAENLSTPDTNGEDTAVVENATPEKPKKETKEKLEDFINDQIGDTDLETTEDYETLLAFYDQSFKNLAEGEVVPGKVLKITDQEVMVDIGYKSEGVIDIFEFVDESGKVMVNVGDEVEVLLERTENQDGYVVLSKEKAERMKVWKTIEVAYKEDRVITGRVIERIKGGLAVDIGIRAFLPGSQVDVRPVRNLESLRGQEFRMKIIKLNKRRGNIVLSRKIVLEEENAIKKTDTLASLEEGKMIKGMVKNITEYGAFIDLGGLDGLLHITDMSWGRVSHPSELFIVGDEVEVAVLKFDRERERVSLGYKQKTPDPWESAEEKYPVGSRVRGKVVSLTDYGAFVELEVGIEGLIHVSEMSWTKRVKHPSKVVAIGDIVETMVLDIDPRARRISLGLKQTEPNPWEMIQDKYAIGTVISGRVRNLTDFGAFIEVEEGIDGLVHISDMSWTRRIKHPSEILKKGDMADAVILNIDTDNQRLSLGIKQLQPNAWDGFFNEFQVGDRIQGKIVRTTDFGVFVELREGVEGLVHVSELDKDRVERPEDKFSVGDSLDMKIVKMEPAEKKIGLSVKAVQMESEDDVVNSYMHDSSEGAIALGDVVGKELSKLRSHISESQAEAEETAAEATETVEAEPVVEETVEPEAAAEKVVEPEAVEETEEAAEKKD